MILEFTVIATYDWVSLGRRTTDPSFKYRDIEESDGGREVRLRQGGRARDVLVPALLQQHALRLAAAIVDPQLGALLLVEVVALYLVFDLFGVRAAHRGGNRRPRRMDPRGRLPRPRAARISGREHLLLVERLRHLLGAASRLLRIASARRPQGEPRAAKSEGRLGRQSSSFAMFA